MLPEKFALIGVARAEGTAESWRDHLYATLKSFVGNAAAGFNIDHIDEAAWRRLAKRISYVQGDAAKPELHEKLRGALDEAEKAHGTQGNAIFYLAIADRLFGTVVGILKAFQSMSVAGTGGFKVVSQGIAAALVATAAGLLVAIYAVIAYNYFVARVNGIAMQYKLYCEEFLAALGESTKGRVAPAASAPPAPVAPSETPVSPVPAA